MIEKLLLQQEKLQKRQEDMSLAFHKFVGKRFGTLEADVVQLRQKILSEQDLRVTDALDYAEAEVQDLRSSLEKVQERHAADSQEFLRQQMALIEQVTQLHASQKNHDTEIQNLNRQYTFSEDLNGPKYFGASYDSKRCSEQLGSVRGTSLLALRSQVETLETKLVADLETRSVVEQTRIGRQECDREHDVQSLKTQIDALETQHHWLSNGLPVKLDEQQAASKDFLQDLQAVVSRQFLEDDSEMGPLGVAVSGRNLCDKPLYQPTELRHQVFPGHCIQRT